MQQILIEILYHCGIRRIFKEHWSMAQFLFVILHTVLLISSSELKKEFFFLNEKKMLILWLEFLWDFPLVLLAIFHFKDGYFYKYLSCCNASWNPRCHFLVERNTINNVLFRLQTVLSLDIWILSSLITWIIIFSI